MALKKRTVYDITNRWSTWVTGYPATPGSASAKGYQYTSSPKTMFRLYQSNPTLRKIQSRNHFDLGSEFFTTRPYCDQVKMWSGSAKSGLYNFSGDMVAVNPANQMINTGLSVGDRNELLRRGTIAIKRCSPLNPVVDGVTALAELRKDGLPKLPGQELLQRKGKQLTRSAGSEYLNIEFAIKPLISDLQNLRKAAIDQEKIISQLHRDSGRFIRRQYTFPTETVTTESVVRGAGAAPTPALVTGFYKSTDWTKTTTTVVKKTYKFSGAFTYYLPPDNTRMGKMVNMAQEAKKLYGIRISPEVVYNLTPWSWALDWVSNTGDIISNMSTFSQDGLVMPYGYIMCHTTSDTTVTVSGGQFYGNIASEYVTKYGYESKVRVKATPFGFGLDPATFSERQWSIIGALGLTKAPKILP